MESNVVYVGLDYHQNSVQVCVMNLEDEILINRKCPNDLAAILGAVQWLAWLRGEAPLSPESKWVVMQELRSLTMVFEQIRQVNERMERYTQDEPLVARVAFRGKGRNRGGKEAIHEGV